MQVLLTGATGLIGSHLITELVQKNITITALTRSIEKAKKKIDIPVNWIESLDIYENLNDFDAVINLAGEPIFDKRWTVRQKAKLKNSRVQLTKKISSLINKSDKPPKCFISGSAAGIYGDKKDLEVTEEQPTNNDFAAKLCKKWEQAALEAQKTRVCLLRTAMVLSPNGGAFAKILPLYKLGLGGPIGNGQQYWAWIHLQDMVRAILFLLKNKEAHGAFNLSSPLPLQQKEFNHILGKVLHRPAFFWAPAFVLKIVLGERANLILDSQKVVPEKLTKLGFEFAYPALETALQDLL